MRSRNVQRYISVGLFFMSTLVAPAMLTAVTTDTNRWRVLAVMAAVSVGATVLGVTTLSSWETRQRRQALISVPGAGPRPILIVSAGPGHFTDRPDSPSLLFRQLRQTRPERLAVVGSAKTHEARDRLDHCLDTVGDEGLFRPTEVKLFLTADADSIDRTPFDEAIKWALSHNGVGPDDVVVDVTGGTTSMSMSGLLAAADAGIDCQIVRQDGTGATRILQVEG